MDRHQISDRAAMDLINSYLLDAGLATKYETGWFADRSKLARSRLEARKAQVSNLTGKIITGKFIIFHL